MLKNTNAKLEVITKSYTGFDRCLNTYNGCDHGCLYCYGRVKISFGNGGKQEITIPFNDWVNSKPRKDLLKKLGKDIQKIKNNNIEIKDILVSSVTDCYQPQEQQLRLTRSAIEMLVQNELPFTVLTKNTNVLNDIDLFTGYDYCRVGFTIMTLDESFRRKLELNASPIQDRIDGLKTLQNAGISTHCSVEPIMPCKEGNPIEIVKTLAPYVDIFEFGMWNPKSGDLQSPIEKLIPVTYDENYYEPVLRNLISYCEQNDIHYCMANHSESFLRRKVIKYIPTQLVTDRPYPNPNDMSAKV